MRTTTLLTAPLIGLLLALPTSTPAQSGARVPSGVRLGPEIGVIRYSAQRAGNGRKNYKRWTPVTVYEVKGRYYPNNGAGARAVTIYRYKDQYFLPPRDDQWVSRDKRADIGNQP
jgi:hypothetical protein